MDTPPSASSHPSPGDFEVGGQFWAPGMGSGLNRGWALRLRAYFASGWAFLIPYLATYLLYNWLKWPSNPTPGTGEGHTSAGVHHSVFLGLHFQAPPPLLYVYWLLHALHLVLAAIPLRSLWRDEAAKSAARSSRPRAEQGLLFGILPWLLLSLVFALPGVYLEWPSDPWEHLRRITEWRTLDAVGGHTAGYKSMYFFAYSLVGRLPADRQLGWLNAYYTAMCLLVAWQYYLLGRSVGLSRRWSFVAVIVNVLTFGNVTFSFYRYYGLASTMFAQLGAVALTRYALDGPWKRRFTGGGNPVKAPFPSAATCLVFLAEPCLLLLLIGCNHVQGLGIAAIGVSAVILWRLVRWRRSTLVWILAVTVLTSVAAFAWYPRDAALDASYRPGGWLNAWYGFNLFAWPSPAADRALQILGLFGVVNLLAGVLLLSRNHVVGWLTIAPGVALSLPCVAIPFANAFAASNPGEILVFHRMFFAIPSALATVVVLRDAMARLRVAQGAKRPVFTAAARGAGFALLLASLTAVLTVPGGPLGFNRVWQLLGRVPDDLRMEPVWQGAIDYSRLSSGAPTTQVVCTSIPGFLINIQRTGSNLEGARHYLQSSRTAAMDMLEAEGILASGGLRDSTGAYFPQFSSFYTPRSAAGFLSGHWAPQEAALAAAGGPELRTQGEADRLQARRDKEGDIFLPEGLGKN
jgi:hypothetical protein